MTLSRSSVLFWYDSQFGERAVEGGDVSFTRDTVAYAYDARGVLVRMLPAFPRFDWMRVEGEVRPVLMAEAGSTNYLLQSTALNASPWMVYNGDTGGTVAATGGADPAGGSTALQATVGGGGVSLGRLQVLAGGALPQTGMYGFSAYVRRVEGSASALLEAYDVTAGAPHSTCSVSFAADGSVGSLAVTGSGYSPGARALGGGWYRVWYYANILDVSHTYYLYLLGGGAAAGDTLAVAWPQFEYGRVTAPIPTTTAAASRNLEQVYWQTNISVQAVAFYSRFVVRTLPGDRWGGASGTWYGPSLTGELNAAPWLVQYASAVNSGESSFFPSGAGSATTISTDAFAGIGDVVELLTLVDGAGRVRTITAVNAATPSDSGYSAAPAAGLGAKATWTRVWPEHFFSQNPTTHGYSDIRVLKLADLVGTTAQAILDEIRDLLLDAAGGVI